MTAFAALLALVGFTALALAMERHQGDLIARRLSPWMRRRMATGGWAALALAFGVTILVWGWAIGPVLWIGLLSPAAMTVLLTLSWRTNRR